MPNPDELRSSRVLDALRTVPKRRAIAGPEPRPCPCGCRDLHTAYCSCDRCRVESALRSIPRAPEPFDRETPMYRAQLLEAIAAVARYQRDLDTALADRLALDRLTGRWP